MSIDHSVASQSLSVRSWLIAAPAKDLSMLCAQWLVSVQAALADGRLAGRAVDRVAVRPVAHRRQGAVALLVVARSIASHAPRRSVLLALLRALDRVAATVRPTDVHLCRALAHAGRPTHPTDVHLGRALAHAGRPTPRWQLIPTSRRRRSGRPAIAHAGGMSRMDLIPTRRRRRPGRPANM